MTDLDSFGEELVSLLQSQLNSGDDVDIEYVYEFREDLGTVVGRKIKIYGLGYLSESPETRKEDQYVLSYGLVVLERYSDPQNPTAVAPKEWLAERTLFVEEKVFNPLSNSRVMFGSSDYQYWSESAETTVYLDRNILRLHKVFWSEIEFTFRKLKV